MVFLSLIFLIELIPLAARVGENLMNEKDWGLSYREHQQPKGNEEADYLKQYDAYFVGNPDEKVIYLTFDAGYENGYTETILDTLEKQDVQATFFLVGHYLKTNPELVRRMAYEGHIVANHTYSHPDMTALGNKERFEKELKSLEVLYKDITGEEMLKLYRPPSGKYSENNMIDAQALGYKTFFWSLAYLDWKKDAQPSRDEAFNKLLPNIHPGAIVLLHSTSKTNAEILDDLITYWKKDDYTFKTLDEFKE